MTRAKRRSGAARAAGAHAGSHGRADARRRSESRSNCAAGPIRGEVARLADDTFRRRNWGHSGLLAVVRDLSVEEASWKPPDLAHTIWQQLHHIAYWRRNVLERLRGRRPRWNQAWPRGGRTAAELRRAVKDLVALSRDLGAAISRIDLDEFAVPSANGVRRYSLPQLLLGETAHLSYHIGQIVLTRKLYRRRASRGLDRFEQRRHSPA